MYGVEVKELERTESAEDAERPEGKDREISDLTAKVLLEALTAFEERRVLPTQAIMNTDAPSMVKRYAIMWMGLALKGPLDVQERTASPDYDWAVPLRVVAKALTEAT